MKSTDKEEQEMVLICDENDVVIGKASRKAMREQKLIHRCTYIFVANSQGQLYV